MSRWPITWRTRRWRTRVWRWPTATPPTVPPEAPPTFTDEPHEIGSPPPDRLRKGEDAEWSEAALRSCLEQLRTSTVTEAHDVVVHDAWIDGPDAFCLVYRNPYFDGLIGIRRHADDALEAIKGRWTPGRSMTAGYDMAEASVLEGRAPDPLPLAATSPTSTSANHTHRRPTSDPMRTASDGTATSTTEFQYAARWLVFFAGWRSPVLLICPGECSYETGISLPG
jgi:hypothetical protein